MTNFISNTDFSIDYLTLNKNVPDGKAFLLFHKLILYFKVLLSEKLLILHLLWGPIFHCGKFHIDTSLGTWKLSARGTWHISTIYLINIYISHVVIFVHLSCHRLESMNQSPILKHFLLSHVNSLRFFS